jgi:ABC-type transport system involved in multi-copper enzyme maturation permease subunit
MSHANLTLPNASALRDAGVGAKAQRGWNNVQAIAGIVLQDLCHRKDFYVLFVLTALITFVLSSVNFFNEDRIVRYLKEICLLLIWISSLVIAITTTARQIPAERENRTLCTLLAKPVTRDHVVLGKFLGCWLASGFALAVFYLFFGIVSGAREHHWPLLSYFQAFSLHGSMLGIVVAMSLLGSIVFAAPSSNNTITFVVVTSILLLGRHLNKVAVQLDEPLQSIVYGVYFAIPHLELFDVRDLIIHNWETVPWLVWAAALGYAAVYTALFLALACGRFRRQRVH